MGMPDVYDEIFDYADVYIKTNSKYSPKVLPSEPQETNTFPSPLVVIQESDNPLVDEDLTKGDQQYQIEYEIKIYAVDKGSVAKQIIIQELKKLVNDVFDVHYGMSRRACIPTPNADRDVDRLYMRYNAIIDKNKTIYRR